MCFVIGVVSTVARDRFQFPMGLALCVDAKSGKQQLVVADFLDHRLLGVDLVTGAIKKTSENVEISLVFLILRSCCLQVL